MWWTVAWWLEIMPGELEGAEATHPENESKPKIPRTARNALIFAADREICFASDTLVLSIMICFSFKVSRH